MDKYRIIMWYKVPKNDTGKFLNKIVPDSECEK